MYTLMANGCVLREDGAFIPNDSDNSDWIAYQTWVSAGNVPNPSIAPSASEKWQDYQSQAKEMLDESDITLMRCYEASIPLPSEWQIYRRALRAIVGAKEGDSSQPLPVKPIYPSGT